MRLGDIIREMQGVTVHGRGDPDVSSVAADSREVESGALFAALPGTKEDGGKYIRDAVARGAVAVLAGEQPDFEVGVPCLVAENPRRAVGEAVDAFHGHPSRSLALIGVTGTNGKTTTAYLVRHLLNSVGRRCGMLGTIEYDLGSSLEPAPLTTPDAIRFTRSLAAMRDAGCRAAVVEASSHALTQGRVHPHHFVCGVFTNLTRDHLDYHGDMDAYLAAKRILFERLDGEATAVLNFHDPASASLASATRARVDGYVLAARGETPGGGGRRAQLLKSGLDGQTFKVDGLSGEFATPLVGRHNVENCLGALLATLSLGVDPEAIRAGLAAFPGVPGRLERLETPSGAKVFVDFSHTDDALKSVLSVLRPLVPGKLITLFGCGGDRDKGKRPLMAKAAETASDRVVVTSDNPRTEDPDRIIADIMVGFARPEAVTVQADRAKAVRAAVAMAGRGDAVLVAGKGHENYQILGTTKIHMDDRELVRAAFGA